MSRLRILFCALASCVFAPRAAVANLLLNGGFETGDFTGWTVGGNAVRGVTTDGTPFPGTSIRGNVVRTLVGNFSAYALLETNTPTNITFSQTVPVDPKLLYAASITYGVRGNGSFDVYFGDSFSSGSPSPIGSLRHLSVASFEVASTYGVFSFPPETTTATFTFELQGSGPSGGLAAFAIDDLYVQPVPEPAGVTCLTLAGFAFISRRQLRASCQTA
jgi:hypothetical protein